MSFDKGITEVLVISLIILFLSGLFVTLLSYVGKNHEKNVHMVREEVLEFSALGIGLVVIFLVLFI
ncbi:hypothetical protein PP175_25755 (plasmid) [Aneurinibacillus sp. Ricciae_BoGa-3]|uniref:hypothetical protein n=1 Tax=Aneurinibacillus sp. Ricciae_BoGa-3 TaxID=3022697 RepID=UPI002341E6B9|nr:hypothetical protein [Aneurinibacillus sp. Ricciae_BoGa-3]WCK57474.1 hypothetical protein PP175_25755 [Aneurinibacillus sp. Ricciae_BoGa-3]